MISIRLTYLLILLCCSVALYGQYDSHCEFALTVAAQKYEKGDLAGALSELDECQGYEDLSIQEKRTFLKLRAEIGLYMQDYDIASDATKKLMIIDPFLKYVDEDQSPELRGLISDYRFNTFALEIHGFGGPQFLKVKIARKPEGSSIVTAPKYSNAWQIGAGIGIQQRWHSFPLDIQLQLDYSLNKFSNTVEYQVEANHLVWNINEVQQWFSPKFFLGYTFAPNALPIERASGFIKIGTSLDYLVNSRWVDNSSLSINGQFVFDSPDGGLDVTDSYIKRLFPAFHVKTGLEIRIHKQTLAMGVGYSFRSLRGTDNFVYNDIAQIGGMTLPVQFISDDVISHSVSFHLAFRYNFYSTMRK
jgi:hypothetical protein